ncbi:MAG: hypothetical protein AAGA03_05065 [Planctomycetota bacterium]
MLFRLREHSGLLGVAFCLGISSLCFGQIGSQAKSELAEDLRAAAGQLDSDRFPNRQQATERFLRQADQVRSYFDRQRDAANSEAWLAYLNLQPVQDALEQEESANKIGRQAVALSRRLVGIDEGLELSAIRQLRSANGDLISALRFDDAEKSLASLQRVLESLASQVESLPEAPTAEDHAKLLVAIQILDEANQATAPLAALRRLFARPNFKVWVSESAVQRGLNRPVNQSRPVRDCILGTRLVGQGCLTGLVSADLLPADGRVRVQLTLSGQFSSRNVGYNGPVSLNTTGRGNVLATRTATVDESGVHLGPTTTEATLKTRINRINHNLRLVRKIAGKKAAQQKPQADRIARHRLRGQVGEQFDLQTSQAASVPMPNVIGRLRPWLERLGYREPARQIGSTNHAIYAEANFIGADLIASAVSAPAVDLSHDATLQIHESLVSNAVIGLLAGRTLTEERIAELLESAGRSLPPREGDEAEKEAFEIDFDGKQPIVFEARDGALKVGVRGRRFAQGTREIDRFMEITALYRPGRLASGSMVLIREGDVRVEFPGTKRLSISQAGLRGVIEERFSKVFPGTLLDQPWTFPSDSQLTSLAGRQYRPTAINAEDGWFTISVR